MRIKFQKQKHDVLIEEWKIAEKKKDITESDVSLKD
jgi:hypothetical protein